MHRDTPTHNLAGMKLNKAYVGRDLMRPEPSQPRALTPPPLVDDVPEFTPEERGGETIELGKLYEKIDEPDLIFPRIWGILARLPNLYQFRQVPYMGRVSCDI
jgi:hypothetical protein